MQGATPNQSVPKSYFQHNIGLICLSRFYSILTLHAETCQNDADISPVDMTNAYFDIACRPRLPVHSALTTLP